MIVRCKDEVASPCLPPLVAALADAVHRADLVRGVLVAPPISRRRRWRGWHLAEELAQRLARRLHWPSRRLIRRREGRRPQAGLGAAARRSNLNHSFAAARWLRWLPDPQALVPARVWIIDDVCTTGATLTECARVLREMGVAEIGALTLARVAELGTFDQPVGVVPEDRSILTAAS